MAIYFNKDNKIKLENQIGELYDRYGNQPLGVDEAILENMESCNNCTLYINQMSKNKKNTLQKSLKENPMEKSIQSKMVQNICPIELKLAIILGMGIAYVVKI